MDSNPLVSVIVPVYNAGEYFYDCLDSILGQTYKNLEVILVDDGSTDGSYQVCDLYSQKDHRVIVIHQKNMGAAAARKAGVFQALGDYICFLDADDAIEEETLDFFVAEMGDCDLLTSGYKCETAPGNYEIQVDSFREGTYNTEETKTYFIQNMIIYEKPFDVGIRPYLGGKFYRTEILKNIISDIDISLVYAEDRDLLFRYILKSGSIRVTHKVFYYYRYNPDSIMRSVNENFMSDLNKLYLSLKKAFVGHVLEESLLYQLQLFLISRLYLVPHFMGFLPNLQVAGYIFPFSELEQGSRIILYGAGTVGVRYYQQICRQRHLQMALWADKDWKRHRESGLPVSSPEQMVEIEYDFIVIAVKRENLAEDIRKELVEMGFSESRILWRPPAVL